MDLICKDTSLPSTDRRKVSSATAINSGFILSFNKFLDSDDCDFNSNLVIRCIYCAMQSSQQQQQTSKGRKTGTHNQSNKCFWNEDLHWIPVLILLFFKKRKLEEDSSSSTDLDSESELIWTAVVKMEADDFDEEDDPSAHSIDGSPDAHVQVKLNWHCGGPTPPTPKTILSKWNNWSWANKMLMVKMALAINAANKSFSCRVSLITEERGLVCWC